MDAIGRKFDDLTGRTFGKLTVLGVVPDSGGSGKHKRWNVRCECGREFTVKSCHLKSGAMEYCSTCHGSGVRRVPQIDGAETSSHTREELSQLQALPLSAKIARTQTLIRAWYEHYDGQVYLSFSGGKDSTVLLHIIREMFPDVPCIFFNTGLEYPEIVSFVKSFDNVELVRPKMTFKETVEKYGYPFISKEVSECVYGARKYLKNMLEQTESNGENLLDRQTAVPYRYRYYRLMGFSTYTGFDSDNSVASGLPKSNRQLQSSEVDGYISGNREERVDRMEPP